MADARVEQTIREGHEWTPHLDSEGLIVVEVKATIATDQSTDVDLKVHFRPFRIRLGTVVRATVYYGSTGALVALELAGGRFNAWTRQETREAKTELAGKATSGIEFHPKLSVALLGAGTVKTEVGGTSSLVEQGSRMEVTDTVQATLSDKCIAERVIEWHYAMHRGEKYVRDFLEETLQLGAQCVWSHCERKKLSISAELDDCGFFAANRRQLTGFKAFLLKCRLARAGVALPSTERITFDVDFG
jgi:hypothetical protein